MSEWSGLKGDLRVAHRWLRRPGPQVHTGKCGQNDRHIELDGDSHGPKGRELLEDLLANSPHREERARRAAYSSIKARIGLWNGTLSKLRNSRGGERSVENQAA